MSAVQATFQMQVKALCTTIEEMGNPFLEESEDLLVLDMWTSWIQVLLKRSEDSRRSVMPSMRHL